MFFQLREQWNCQFLEEDLKTPLKRRVSFPDRVQLLEFAQRGGCVLSPEDRQEFEQGLSIGRGDLWLNLTPAQYAKLKP